MVEKRRSKNPKKVEKVAENVMHDGVVFVSPEVAKKVGEALQRVEERHPELNEDEAKLSRAAATLSRQFGDKSMLFLKEHPDYAKVQYWISTGNYAMNWICSGMAKGGGFPAGRVIDLYGDPSCGKSLLLAHFLAETQKLGGLAVLFDVEATFDRMFAERIGLNWKLLLYTKAYRKEKRKAMIIGEDGKPHEEMIDKTVGASVQRVLEMLDETIDLLHHQFPDRLITIGVDSVSNLTTEHELDVGVEKKDMTKAQTVRQMMRLLEGKMSDMNVTLVITSHTTANIDTNPWAKRQYGPKLDKVTTGGTGVPFASSVRFDLVRGPDITKEKVDVIGHEIKVLTYKNKVFAPKKTVLIDMYFDRGVDANSGLLDILVNKEVVEDLGAQVYRFSGKRFKRHKMHPYPGFDEILEKHPEMLDALSVEK